MTLRVVRDEASSQFFDAALRGTLLIRRCLVCDVSHSPETSRCPRGHDLEWQEAAGGGSLISWAVDHSPALASSLGAGSGIGSIVGLVELDEGPWIQVAILGADPLQLRVGLGMGVDFVHLGDEALPVFRVAPDLAP